MKYLIGTCLIWLLTLPSVFGESVILVDDCFDDGDPATNMHGIGNGWGVRGHRIPKGPGSLIEKDGTAIFTVAREHGSMWLWSQPADGFDITDQSLKITWGIEKVAIPTPHKYGKDFAFHWNLGIVGHHENNIFWAHPPKMKKAGGLFINIGHPNNHTPAKFQVWLADDTVDMEAGEYEGGGFVTAFNERFASYTGSDSLKVSLTVSKSGWQIDLSEALANGNKRIQGLWNHKGVEIDTEFDDGVFISTIGRNSGIGEPGIGDRPNAGYISSIKIVRN